MTRFRKCRTDLTGPISHSAAEMAETLGFSPPEAKRNAIFAKSPSGVPGCRLTRVKTGSQGPRPPLFTPAMMRCALRALPLPAAACCPQCSSTPHLARAARRLSSGWTAAPPLTPGWSLSASAARVSGRRRPRPRGVSAVGPFQAPLPVPPRSWRPRRAVKPSLVKLVEERHGALLLASIGGRRLSHRRGRLLRHGFQRLQANA
jgi:hypothetical protein